MAEIQLGQIGRYTLEKENSCGGMSVVYKAEDLRLYRPVAIKLIQMKAFAENSFGSVRERFKREALSFAKLNHPNIVKVYDFGGHDGVPYLVMEYIEGRR